MSQSLLKLTDAMIVGDIKRLRIEANEPRTRFTAIVDFGQGFSGSTVNHACDRAWDFVSKKLALDKERRKSSGVPLRERVSFLEHTAEREA